MQPAMIGPIAGINSYFDIICYSIYFAATQREADFQENAGISI